MATINASDVLDAAASMCSLWKMVDLGNMMADELEEFRRILSEMEYLLTKLYLEEHNIAVLEVSKAVGDLHEAVMNMLDILDRSVA